MKSNLKLSTLGIEMLKTHTRRLSVGRTTFTTSRELEFFTQSELSTQIGSGPDLWPLALVKELLDNSLDAIEMNGVSKPRIDITIKKDSITVADNGPGLPSTTLEKSLDYTVRVSDKKGYVSPTRGQLGNALKCLWAAPVVANGPGLVAEVHTHGERHRISIAVDNIAQKPNIEHQVTKSMVKSGTSFTIHWPDVAGFTVGGQISKFYRGELPIALRNLLISYWALNPAATFTLNGKVLWTGSAADAANPRWTSAQPTSAWWYQPEDIQRLIAAFIKEQDDMFVRDFVAQFAGLKGTQVRAEVMQRAGIKDGMRLSNLRTGNDIDLRAVRKLLTAMQQNSKEVKAKRLGLVGRDTLETAFRVLGSRGGFKYAYDVWETTPLARHDSELSLPCVVEVAFSVGPRFSGRHLIMGLNFSPILTSPFYETLSEMMLDPYDDIICLVHVVRPRFVFTDHSKGQIEIGSTQLKGLVQECLEKVTREFQKEKRKENSRQLSEEAAERLASGQDEKLAKQAITETAYSVMAEAYAKASGGGKYPTKARQIMYAARKLVLDQIGRCWKNDNDFTQKMLPTYQEEHPEETAKWDVVYDARGHLTEPHVRHRVDLGTVEVRTYISGWGKVTMRVPDIEIDELYPTRGPKNRYKYALFIEKEGFDALIVASRLIQRYDLAVFSTKGMSTTSARLLVDKLAGAGVTVLIAHDFDDSGLTIAHTLCHDGRRYTFTNTPKVIDIGLRLPDVKRMRLQSEPVRYTQFKDPREKFRDQGYDVTEAELNFLVTSEIEANSDKKGKGVEHWEGKRVELNALTSPQFVDWLERKFIEHEVTKVIPDEPTLVEAWQRGQLVTSIKRSIKVLTEAAAKNPLKPPANLSRWVRAELKKNPYKSWDEVLVPRVEE